MTTPLTVLDEATIAELQPPPCDVKSHASQCAREAVWIVRATCCKGHLVIALLCDWHWVNLRHALAVLGATYLCRTCGHGCPDAEITAEPLRQAAQ